MTTPPLRRGPGPRADADHVAVAEVTDREEMAAVNRYLIAVADELARRRVAVRALHADLEQGPDGPVATATVTLDPAPCPRPRWLPTCLRWRSDDGWSATLQLIGGDRSRSERRYLPGSVAPGPTAVAHFAAALEFDHDTHWASRIFDRPRPLSRNRLTTVLAGSARPGEAPDPTRARRQ